MGCFLKNARKRLAIDNGMSALTARRISRQPWGGAGASHRKRDALAEAGSSSQRLQKVLPEFAPALKNDSNHSAAATAC